MYVVTPHLNRLIETIQMRGNNIWFQLEIKIIPQLSNISYLEFCIKVSNFCIFKVPLDTSAIFAHISA